MQAFPVGALNMLVAVASAIAAQHSPENARRVSIELAANNELWAYIASRLGGHVGPAGDRNRHRAQGPAPLAELEPHPRRRARTSRAAAKVSRPGDSSSTGSEGPHIDVQSLTSPVVPDAARVSDRRRRARARTAQAEAATISRECKRIAKGEWGGAMKERILVRAAQLALRGLALQAERLDGQLKNAFIEIGLPVPDRTRGQEFARTMRGYATRLGSRLPRGPEK
jgi:hypothetical protein